MTKRSNIFLRSAIAAIISSLICILFIQKEHRYAPKVVSTKPFDFARQYYYFDLDHDDRSEKILYYTTVNGLASLIFYEWDGDLIKQVNLEGNIIERSEIYAGDYNTDGKDELFVFTYLGDTLYLNVVDPFTKDNQVIASKRIDGCRTLNGVAKYSINGSTMEDMDEDGYREFYFSINAGFTLSPRRVYCYNLRNDSLLTSPLAGSGPRYRFRSEDIDGDGFIEIFGESTAYNNYNDSIIPYSDRSAWLMVYSHLLQFEFEPIEFPGFSTLLEVQTLRKDDTLKLVAFRYYRGINDSIENEILLFDTKGNIKNRTHLSGISSTGRPDFYINNSNIIINNYEGSLFVYNDDLELISKTSKEWLAGSLSGLFQIKDEPEMLVLSGRDGTLKLLDHTFKTKGILRLGDFNTIINSVQALSSREAPQGMLVKTKLTETLISWELNPRRYFVYVYWVVIFSVVFAFIYIIQLIQNNFIKVRIETENKLKTLQLQSLENQMNPHFIFNALNSISAMYMTGNSNKAEKFLVSFSRMIREVVDSSDRVIVKLEEEITFVKSYLELEKVRHGENFTFTIQIPDNCKGVLLPSMSIHAFVENSVKHAFLDKSGKMIIEVRARRNKNLVDIEIKDNGIGFGNAENPTGCAGKGMKMVEDIMSNYSKISGKKMQFSYRNLDPGNNPNGGSSVEVRVEA